jgi:hypothetical protein
MLREVGVFLECAVRGKVTPRTLDGWLAQLAERDDRPAAAAALRGRLIEKANVVELLGIPRHPNASTSRRAIVAAVLRRRDVRGIGDRIVGM